MMKNNIFVAVVIIMVCLLSALFFSEQQRMKTEIMNLNQIVKGLLSKDELVLKKLKIINKFGDTVVELSENQNFSGYISIFNKSNANTVHLSGGNEDENPGILMLKNKDEISFALMVHEKKNLLNIYNENGLDVVSVGTDGQGNGGYSLKNVHDKAIKTEGWLWRAYNY